MKPILKSPLDEQLSLFGFEWEQIDKDYNITYHQSILLSHEGVLSFTPNERDELLDCELRELLFLKKLFFDTGLPRDFVFSMLALLEKPYRYSFNDIYWDFDKNHWKLFQDYTENYLNSNIKEQVISRFNDILTECDSEEIQYCKEQIDRAIERTEEESK